jgi:hypothetical protein
MPIHAEFISNSQVAIPLVRQQHDAAARDYLLGGTLRADPRLKQFLLLAFQLEDHHAASKPHGNRYVWLFSAPEH